MFTLQYRERLREHLVEKAGVDPRLVAAAAVGSSASGGDRWSDLDLTFALADGVPVETVLEDWTKAVIDDYGAAVLFDLPSLSTIYRVFLFPGMLQVDLSFTPAADFGARGPRFELLFGEAHDLPQFPPPAPDYLFGLAVHHLVRAHICINRGRPWQAEYWLHEARDLALSLACERLGLSSSHGRGFDSLPTEVIEPLAGALVAHVTVDELTRAVTLVTAALLREAPADSEGTKRVKTMLAEISQPT